MKKKKWKFYYINPKGKFILLPQEQCQGTSVYSIIQRTINKNWHTNTVTHPSTSQGQSCLTPMYQAVGCSSMLRTTDKKKAERKKNGERPKKGQRKSKGYYLAIDQHSDHSYCPSMLVCDWWCVWPAAGYINSGRTFSSDPLTNGRHFSFLQSKVLRDEEKWNPEFIQIWKWLVWQKIK